MFKQRKRFFANALFILHHSKQGIETVGVLKVAKVLIFWILHLRTIKVVFFEVQARVGAN